MNRAPTKDCVIGKRVRDDWKIAGAKAAELVCVVPHVVQIHALNCTLSFYFHSVGCEIVGYRIATIRSGQVVPVRGRALRHWLVVARGASAS